MVLRNQRNISVWRNYVDPNSDKYYNKGSWYTQTFLCQLVRGRSENQFFHYFGLLHNLLHRQDLLSKWFERRLKRIAMFLFIFGKLSTPGWFYCSNSQGNFEMTFRTFRLSIISITCIWFESSVRRFLSAGFIENSKSHRSGATTRTSHSRKFERSFAEI